MEEHRVIGAGLGELRGKMRNLGVPGQVGTRYGGPSGGLRDLRGAESEFMV